MTALAVPRRTEDAAIDVFNERLQAEGHLGLRRRARITPDAATTIDNRGGEAMITDGPFVETKEYLVGFWIIEAPDLDVALKLAIDGSRACNPQDRSAASSWPGE